MINFHNVSLLEILPENLRADKKVAAIAQALDVELKKLSAETKKVLHLPRLDELSHDVLNQLAYQYHADFFEPELMSLETKRQIVANVLHQHFKLGTAYAVKKLLQVFSSSIQIKEWFEYGGAPYHFKLILKNLEDLEDDGETILRLIDVAKNVRSHLSDFEFDLTRPAPDEVLYFAILQLWLGKIFFDISTEFQESQNLAVKQFEITHGKNIFDLPSYNNSNLPALRAGFFVCYGGKITFGTEIEIDDDLWYELFLNWIRRKWKDWHGADIFYDGDEPDKEPDEETFEGDFLKLWIDFKRSDFTRVLKVYFPRENLSGADINAVNVEDLFLKRGFFSNKIIRAVYIKKTETKLFF